MHRSQPFAILLVDGFAHQAIASAVEPLRIAILAGPWCPRTARPVSGRAKRRDTPGGACQLNGPLTRRGAGLRLWKPRWFHQGPSHRLSHHPDTPAQAPVIAVAQPSTDLTAFWVAATMMSASARVRHIGGAKPRMSPCGIARPITPSAASAAAIR